MKSIITTEKRIAAIILFMLSVLLSQVFISCNKEEIKADPYFFIEGYPTGLQAIKEGSTQSYVVRSNRPWKIIPQEEGDWARPWPTEGTDDGIFKIIVDENPLFEDRLMNFAFIVDGEEQAVLFRVDQEANIPFIEVTNAVDDTISVQSQAGPVSIEIKANVPWTYSIDDESWLSEETMTETQLTLLANKNPGGGRYATITLSSDAFPALKREVVISQSPGLLILEEGFDWLNYGSAVPYEYSGEKRYDLWTPEEKNKGWYVTPNDLSDGQQCTYARIGFVKLGKTNYGGDLISPALSIEGTANIKVTFKAAVYRSSTGTVDSNVLKVFADGAGSTSVSEFAIDNIPNSLADDEAGVINDIWDPARAYSFTVTGATSSTKIRFLGGDYDNSGYPNGKNRIFLDDIKVEIIP